MYVPVDTLKGQREPQQTFNLKYKSGVLCCQKNNSTNREYNFIKNKISEKNYIKVVTNKYGN